MPQPTGVYYDAGVELVPVEACDEYGLPIDAPEVTVVLFGTVIPTDCEHTHVEPLTAEAQTWN